MPRINEKKIRLGVNTLFHVPGDVGGTETYLIEMLRAIVQAPSLTDLVLFTNCNNHDLLQREFDHDNRTQLIKVPVRSAKRPHRIIAEQFLLPFYVLPQKIDMLWSPGYTAPFWCGCPQVVTIHDVQYKSHPDDLSFLERITLDTLVRLACRRCKAVIAVSEFSRQEIIRHSLAGAGKIQAILEGVDQFKNAVIDRKAGMVEIGKKIPADTPFILCVAHVYPHKQIDKLVKAFALVKDEIPHNLVLVGKPRLGEPALQKALKELACPERVIRFTEGVAFDLLKVMYEQANFFILPSSYEGFGLPILEAMISGTPVVCVQKASLPEVAGDYGFYVDEPTPEKLAEAMLQVTRLPSDHRAKHTDAARQWASSFTWKKSAEKTLSFFYSTSWP